MAKKIIGKVVGGDGLNVEGEAAGGSVSAPLGEILFGTGPGVTSDPALTRNTLGTLVNNAAQVATVTEDFTGTELDATLNVDVDGGSDLVGLKVHAQVTGIKDGQSISGLVIVLEKPGTGGLPDVTGIRITTPNVSGGSIQTVIGLNIANQSGGSMLNAAIKTGLGKVIFGDDVFITGGLNASAKIEGVTFAVNGAPGVDGSFTTVDLKTVTVSKGLITSII
jgi:hypothetical protein